MAIQKFIAKSPVDGMVRRVGNSLAWFYICDEKKIRIFKENGPMLEYPGNFVNKMVVFKTGEDYKFLGEAKLPKNPIRKAMWLMGWTRPHETQDIEHAEDWSYVTETIWNFVSKSGNLKVRSGRRYNDTFFWWWWANWSAVTMEDVHEFAIHYGEVDTLGIPRRDESSEDIREFTRTCTGKCNECKYSKHHASWPFDCLTVAEYWTCEGPKCDGRCNICIHQEKGGRGCILKYKAMYEEKRSGRMFFENKKEETLYKLSREHRGYDRMMLIRSGIYQEE